MTVGPTRHPPLGVQQASWRALLTRQRAGLPGRAYPGFFDHLARLELDPERLPTLAELDARVAAVTGWRLVPVEGMIDARDFFALLAERRFPSTTYIRDPSNLGLNTAPDMFHEVFGHVTLLFDPTHAANVQRMGTLGLMFDAVERGLLSRLYWYIFETGLVQTAAGPRLFGGAVLSSIAECEWVFDPRCERVPLDVLDALRTPYRADIFHYRYYVHRGAAHVADLLADADALRATMRAAYAAGEDPPWWRFEGSPYASVGLCATTLAESRHGRPTAPAFDRRGGPTSTAPSMAGHP